MPRVHLPTADSRVTGRIQAEGQVKAFLVHCSLTGTEQLVGRDSVIAQRGKPAVYYCGACREPHELHLWSGNRPRREGTG